MTNRMRNALTRANNTPLQRTHNQTHGKPPWPEHPATLNALERQGMLTRTTRTTRHGHRIDEWHITDTGRQTLQPTHRTIPHKTRLIARTPQQTGPDAPNGASSYTTSHTRSIPDAGEAIDQQTLERYAMENQQAKTRRLLDYEHTRAQMRLEDRLAAVRQAAQHHGIDLSRQEASIETRIAAMERRIQYRSVA